MMPLPDAFPADMAGHPRLQPASTVRSPWMTRVMPGITQTPRLEIGLEHGTNEHGQANTFRHDHPGHRRGRRCPLRGRIAVDPERAARRQCRPHAGARSGAASRREHRAHGRDGHDRRAGARRRGGRYRQPDHDAGRPRDPGPHPQRDRRAGRRARPGRHQPPHADPPGRRRNSSSSRPRRRSSSPASRSSICWRPTPRAARSACSAAPASARPSSSWN